MRVQRLNLPSIAVSKNDNVLLNATHYIAIIFSTDDSKYRVIKGAGMLTKNRNAHEKLISLVKQVIPHYDSNSWNISLITIKNDNNIFLKDFENECIKLGNLYFTRWQKKIEYFICTKQNISFKQYIMLLSKNLNIKFDKRYTLKETYIVDEDIDYISDSEIDDDDSGDYYETDKY